MTSPRADEQKTHTLRSLSGGCVDRFL